MVQFDEADSGIAIRCRFTCCNPKKERRCAMCSSSCYSTASSGALSGKHCLFRQLAHERRCCLWIHIDDSRCRLSSAILLSLRWSHSKNYNSRSEGHSGSDRNVGTSGDNTADKHIGSEDNGKSRGSNNSTTSSSCVIMWSSWNQGITADLAHLRRFICCSQFVAVGKWKQTRSLIPLHFIEL